jgi:L-amino acid N-acyltransferase YncA
MSVAHATKALDPYVITPVVRALTKKDSEAYRRLRERVLKIGEGRYFNTSYIRESKLSEQEWQEWCHEKKEHCIIGTFIDEELVGIMMVTMFGPPEDLTAEWEATWLDPIYRGCGIAQLAYKKVQAWTRDQGYKYAQVFIREDNSRSREIREKQGFVYVRTIYNETWADGSIGAEHVFIKDLSQNISESTAPYTQATQYQESVLKFLEETEASRKPARVSKRKSRHFSLPQAQGLPTPRPSLSPRKGFRIW